MNKITTFIVIALILIWFAWFWYVWYSHSLNFSENLNITINENNNDNKPDEKDNVSVEENGDENNEETTNKKEKNYHIWDEEFWNNALDSACKRSYDDEVKWLCKHDKEKIEIIARWIEDSRDLKYKIVFRIPSKDSFRYYEVNIDEDSYASLGSSWWEDISQEAVAVKDCWEDKIYTYINNSSETYDNTTVSVVTLKYNLNGKTFEEQYIFDRRGNEILEKHTNTFINEEEATEIISKDSWVSTEIIKKAEDNDWLFKTSNWLNTENQLYSYQFTNNWYTYNYTLDATNGEIKSKDIQKDIWEKWALDIAMNDLEITEDSFLRHHGEYMISFAFPDVKKETTDESILYKISLSENDDISHYYEINWHNWEILKHSFTTLYIINKKNWWNYDINAESDKSIKYTINLKKIWMDDIYKFKDYIYLNIQYEWDNLIDWTIIDKDSNSDLWKSTNNELDELYNFESKHKIVYAGSFTWGEILLSSLKENIIYKYTIPKWSYCEPKIINDLWTDCIVYKKEEWTSNAIQYKSIPAPVLNYPWASPLHWYCTMGGDDWGFYITYKKASVEELLNISKNKVLNLSQFKRWEKIDREHWRTSDIDYLYNDTNDDITLFISNWHSNREWLEDMIITVPPKQLIFCSYSVSDITLIKKWSWPEANIKMTKKEAAALALSDRWIKLNSDNFTATVKLFKNISKNKEIYEVIIKTKDKSNKEQLYITYIDIETRSVIITEKKLFSIISEEPWLSLKKINDWIIKYWLEKDNINNFSCSIESDWLIYDFTINIDEERIISRNIKDYKWKNVWYWPDNQLYPIEEIDVHWSLYLSDLEENVIYKFFMTSKESWRLYNRLGYPVILHEKVIKDNQNQSNYESRILENGIWVWIWSSAEHDEETYLMFINPTPEELINFIWNNCALSKHLNWEPFKPDFSYHDYYLYNDTDITQNVLIEYSSEDKTIQMEPWELFSPERWIVSAKII